MLYGCEVLSSRGGLSIHSECLQFLCNHCGSVRYLSVCSDTEQTAQLFFFCRFFILFFMSLPPLLENNQMLTTCDIVSPAATTACTRSAERKQSGYCGPLGWPAPILRAPTPPAMTTRGIDMHGRCICASAIVWSPQVVPRPSLIYPWSYVWWRKTKDILSDIAFCSRVITALELLM